MATNEYGENLLDTLPQYGGAGGSQQAANYYAAHDFYKQFGRNPTQSELTSLAAAYMSGDPNIANTAGGQSAIAQYYQAIQNTPEKQNARDLSAYTEKSSQYNDQINGMFQQSLGRDASYDELRHFGSMLASGQVDAYTVGQYLQALPESVKKQDADFRNSMNSELQASDARYFNEQVMPSIQSQFANQGRDFRSSGFANSLAQAATQQNRQRESFLSGLTADQYNSNKSTARSDYETSLSRQYGLQDYSRQRSAQMQDASTNRVNELQNYALQKQAYDQYLSRYGNRSGGLSGGISGASSGAMAGSYFGPWGAAIGAVGGGLLGAFKKS
jgi:hypothetical protein